MTNRRQFLQSSSALLTTLALGRHAAFAAGHIPVGLQLYTVRHLADADLPSVLEKVRSIGYEEVELYWNVYSRPARDLQTLIVDSGLKAPSGHFDYDGLNDKFEYAKEIGVDWIVCPMLPASQQTSLEGFHKAAKQFNEWGKRAQDQGQRFAFHNHNYEFKQIDGRTGYSVLLEETDPALVWFELDCYWVTQAGRSPEKLLGQLGSRCKLLHIKDRKPNSPVSQDLNAAAGHFTPVGRGTIDWKEIIAGAKQLKVEHYFVEQDESDIPPLEAVRESFNYLQPLLG